MTEIYKLNTLIPLEEIEGEAQNQLFKALELPFLKKLAAMPDIHAGYALPIGGVALLENVISPHYIGFDQGCGMCLYVTDIKAEDLKQKDFEKINKEIYKRVPVGFNWHKEAQDYPEFKSAIGDSELDNKVASRLAYQLGTLGGGNHFIEIGKNKDGYIAVVIHSGSRNPGHSVGGYYMNKSKEVDNDLPTGFFHLESEYGRAFLKDMNFMLEYALANRMRMMREVLDALKVKEFKIEDIVNENHNHAIVNEDGTVLHRKGATPADEGQKGVIPANMRDGTYVTVGLGNEEYLSSASHGAGRKMSRKKAKKSIDHKRFKEQMKGIIANTDKEVLDEAPDAYKKIDTVINYQKGVVVDVIDRIEPIISVKG